MIKAIILQIRNILPLRGKEKTKKKSYHEKSIEITDNRDSVNNHDQRVKEKWNADEAEEREGEEKRTRFLEWKS